MQHLLAKESKQVRLCRDLGVTVGEKGTGGRRCLGAINSLSRFERPSLVWDFICQKKKVRADLEMYLDIDTT